MSQQSIQQRLKAADAMNIRAARIVLEKWHEVDGMQREWAMRCIKRLGTPEDKQLLERLEETKWR